MFRVRASQLTEEVSSADAAAAWTCRSLSCAVPTPAEEAEAEADARIAKLVEELAARERQLRMADKQRQIRELEAKLGRK